MREYELFLDESGRFTEGMRDDGRRFPSQIAGLIAPAGKITARAAEELLGEVLASIERPLPAVVHANEWKKGAEFDRLVLALSGSLRKRSGWQAIRLENREGLGFGAIESTYTRMVAELCVRALEQVTKGDDGEVKLRVIAASYWVDGEAQLGADAYVERLEEHLAYAALRRGLAAESARWKLAGIRFESGRTRRELQLCDLLSNASHSGYGKLGAEARTALERCFAGYDFRLTVRELSRRVDEHLEEGSFGLALQALAEELCSPEALSADARRDAEARLSAVVEGLAALSAAVRAPQLAVLTVWLEQLIEQRRDAVMGLRAARWLAANVEAPLSAQVGDSLAPFSLALSRHALTAANHQGALGAAREAVSAIQRLIPQLAGRWEHGPVILECMVAESVHLTDTLEHEAVARRMGAVAAYYETLSSLLSDALEGVFPEAVRSEQRGRALGTQMQAEMYAGLADPLRFEEARRLNEEAMRELGAPEEIARQQQYRCQLETFAGEAASAREHLAESLSAEPTHAAIAARIVELAPVAQGFALLHWLRLGALVLARSDAEDRASFTAALKGAKAHTLAWCTDAELPYPAHGVRRQLAINLARQGEAKRAESMLGELRRLGSDAATQPVLALIEAAAHLEVAGLLGDARAARRLLETFARPRVRELHPRVAPFPALARLIAEWDAALGRALSGQHDATATRDELLRCGRFVGY